MAEPNPAVSAKKVSRVDEEQIVQSIVELLNEKGYEYERDARPIICWKYNVVSSRELSYDQKIEVKEALENGSFEKWGLEYRKKVLDEQVDIVDEIKKLDGAPTDITVKIDDEKKKKSEKGKIKINIKDTPKKTTKVSPSKTDPTTEDRKNSADEEKKQLKIPSAPLPAKKEKDGLSSVASKDKKPKLVQPSAGLSVQKDKTDSNTSSGDEKSKLIQSSSSMKLDALGDKKTDIKLKLVSKDPDLKPQDKSDQKIDPQPMKIQGRMVSVPPQEEKQESAVKKILTEHDSPKDEINGTARPKMRIDEARNIVKERFSSDVEESSLLSSFTLMATLVLFIFSLYTNYLLLTEKSFPEWLIYICNYVSG